MDICSAAGACVPVPCFSCCRRGTPDGAPDGATLRLRGLPYSATEAEVTEFFKGAADPYTRTRRQLPKVPGAARPAGSS